MRFGTSDSTGPLSDDLDPAHPIRFPSSEPSPGRAAPGGSSDPRRHPAQECASEGIWEWDIDTGAVRWSDETYRLFGVERASYVPSLDGNAAFVHPEDRRPYHQALAATLRTGQPLDYDLRLITPSGEVRHCNVRANVVCDSRGKQIRVAGTCHDITERRRAELQQAFERLCLETSLSGLSEGVILVDPLGHVAFLNPAVERMTGWAADQARFRPLGEVLRLIEESTGEVVPLSMAGDPQENADCGGSGKALLVAADGEGIPVAWRVLVIRDGDFSAGMTVVLRRRTDAGEMAETLARLQNLQANASLAGGIAHELNNVLGGVFGCVELARLELPPDAPAALLLDEALSAYLSARELTARIMRLTK